MERKAPLLVVCLLVLSLFLGSPSAWGLDLKEEKELGREILKTIRQHYRLINDQEVAGYVQSVGQRVVKSLGATHYDYRFFVIDDGTPNAFAIPGGYVFLFRGIIELMDSEAELASIICHEVAHVQARHVKKMLEKGRVLNIAAMAGALAGAFLGLQGDAAQAIAVGSMAGAKSLALKFSRENEEEADRLGFRYLCAAGYDPYAMVSIMRKMNRMGWQSDSRIPSYLRTHPALGERLGYLELLAQNAATSHATCTVRDPMGDFPLVQAVLMSRHTDPAVARDRFRAWLHDDTHRVGAAYGLGRLALDKGEVKEALGYLRRAAAWKPDSVLILSALGDVYHKMGRLDEATKALEEALKREPDSPVAHLRLGLVLQDQGRWQQALQHLKKAESLAPYNPLLDYHLGILYGRIDQLGDAHYFLGRYYQRTGNRKLAAFHYEKARSHLPESDPRQKKIDDALKGPHKKERPG
ncbi:Putative Zn-dependent protease, contains TPR repeats [Desulfacinum hydrothermale DSM 13146]|uniref:Putative Zn-dependent protease, contains TPR repeats n=1 Tax=Desulfacinum hydrothermale DSM 13146 TaxID=1121390 RepID=A0A1W1XD03_9BACT|nr:M48 family metallopeptidase [Desulfacinum hydrothermale]SMC21773.1 Putative Zn-dependent protease, contains TPR repeats [Desulfacinum hydrothermale DSM 13146]